MTRADCLLSLVADRPAGTKVNIPAIVRAFTPTQRQICAAIEKLVADGKLDAATLRRPIETPAASLEPPAEPPNPQAVEEGGGDARRSDAPPPEGHVVLKPLYGQERTLVPFFRYETTSFDLDKLLGCFGPEFETLRVVAQRFGAPSPNKIVRYARMLLERRLVEQHPPTNGNPFCLWRRTKKNTQGGSRTARKAPGAASSGAAKSGSASPPPTPPNVDIKVNSNARRVAPCPSANDGASFQRKAQLALRTNRKAAEAFLDGGKTAEQAPSVSLKIEARKVEAARREQGRLLDPVEHAKTLLRRRYPMVVNAEIVGGPKGKFVVGNRTVDEKELLAMAGRLAA